jgi:colanic acid biosynthesis glycosyl transferase WcaI
MKILILGLNYAPENIGIAVYTTEMAEELLNLGHKVKVVSGNPYYPNWKIRPGYKIWKGTCSNENGVNIRRVAHYIPQNPSGIKRIIHHASFALTSFFPMIHRALFWKPDIIFTVAPSLLAAPNAWLAAKLGGAKSWLHIQDFEVEASFATGLLTDGSIPAKTAKVLEKKVISLFDRVSSISPHMCKKLKEKGVTESKIYEFRNWADIEAIQPITRSSLYRKEWGIITPHIALYCGNIANKQGINIIVEAARLIQHRDDITFVICGEGPSREKLILNAEGLTNVQFHNLQPKERLNELLGLATVHLLPQCAGTADLVLPSKLTNMLASGKPVIATVFPETDIANEILECGFISPPGDALKLANTICQALEDIDSLKKLGNNARFKAENIWSKEKILKDAFSYMERTLVK